jgi:hypothetical protein
MSYTAEAAACSDIRTKHWTQSENNVQLLNINILATEFYI